MESSMKKYAAMAMGFAFLHNAAIDGSLEYPSKSKTGDVIVRPPRTKKQIKSRNKSKNARKARRKNR